MMDLTDDKLPDTQLPLPLIGDAAPSWKEATFVAFDTETTGRYPLVAELVEIAAVKWKGGVIVDKYQTFARPT